MNARELATILAALRYWQREGLASGGHERDIATDQGEFDAMSDTEIDTLCEQVNLAGLGLVLLVEGMGLEIVPDAAPEPAIVAGPPDALSALRALFACKHMDLGDMVYTVREREGLGWDGPAVTAWNKAVTDAKAVLKAHTPSCHSDVS